MGRIPLALWILCRSPTVSLPTLFLSADAPYEQQYPKTPRLEASLSVINLSWGVPRQAAKLRLPIFLYSHPRLVVIKAER